jgi:hypothetical protein
MAVLRRARHHGKAIGHPGKMLQGSLRVIDQGEGSKASSWHIEKIAGGDPGCTCPPAPWCPWNSLAMWPCGPKAFPHPRTISTS